LLNGQQLFAGLQRENLTAVLSHEATVHETTLEVAKFLSDTVIVLKSEREERGIRRSLEITKSRGQDFDNGQHSLRITSDIGLEVFRRVQARASSHTPQPTSEAKRSVIGIEPLDTLIGGGIFDGSTTMVVGISGAGKTVLGVQLLLEGARTQDKRRLLVSLDEHPAQILRNAGTLGLDLNEFIEAGKIHLLYESPQELNVDVHFDRVVRFIEEHKIERMVVDGMTSYSASLRDQRMYRDFFHALVGYCKHNLITTFFSYENPELFGLTHFMPEFGVSSIVDNIIMLNIVELGNTLHRAITVAKARGSAHEFRTHEYVIGQGGISLIPVDETRALPVLPFQSYYGLISRAPARLSPDLTTGSTKKDIRDAT
jgi:circadian clock protein KaiC